MFYYMEIKTGILTWEVINCHTNKTVVNWIIPNSKGKSFGNEEWNKSYE